MKTPIMHRTVLHLYFALLALFSITTTNAQETITIGTGVGYTGSLPLTSNFAYSYSQQIVSATEFTMAGGVAGPITKIRYYIITAEMPLSAWNNWTIYLGHTEKDSFSSDTDWEPVSNLTHVFTGTVTQVAGSWMEITFTTPFVYDGTSNLIVAVDENSPEYTWDWDDFPAYFDGYTSNQNTGIFRTDYDTYTDVDPASPGTGERTSMLASIQFAGTVNACVPPSSVTAVADSPATGTVTWTEPWSTVVSGYEYYYSTSNTAPTVTTTPSGSAGQGVTTAALTGLSSNTSYYVWVRSSCGATASSAWSDVANFMTPIDGPCSAPTDIAVTANSPGAATATWTPPESVPISYYWYYYSTSNIPPPAGPQYYYSEPDSTSVELLGLEANTTYYFWIKTFCSETESSDWSMGVSFTTPVCTPVNVPYTEDFESAQEPLLPECTTVENLGQGNTWETADGTGLGWGSKMLNYAWHGLYDADTWFYTKGINLTAGTSYRISYRYGNTDNIGLFYENLEVAYGTDNNVAAMTMPLADHPDINTGTAVSNFVDFIPPVSGVYYFGFHAYSEADQDRLFLDDISVTLSPPCTIPAPAPVVEDNTPEFCKGATVADLVATGTDILWYASAEGGTALDTSTELVNNVAYYVSQTIDGCESPERTMITVSIVTVAMPAGETIQIIEETEEGTATIEDIEVIGENMLWYASEEDALAAVNPLASGTLLQSGATYYVNQTVDGCTSAPLGITVTVQLGNDNFDEASFIYYPNPVKAVLNISYSTDITCVTVYNLLGQQILSKELNAAAGTVDMSALQDGAYLVNVTSGGSVEIIKIIKK
jgi:hypothetical protein